MSRRIAFQTVITVVAVLGLLLSLAGCFGRGSKQATGVPPTVNFSALKTLQYNSTIPITIKVDSRTDTRGSLAFLFQYGEQGYQNMTPAPGRPNPTSFGQLIIPDGKTTFIFWWHAVADLPPGEKYSNVFVKVILTTEDGDIIEQVSGNLTVDYTDDLGGSLPPLVPGGSLPPGNCGDMYDQMLTVEGGYPPFVWSLLPVGASLPWYLELTHDGHVKGEVPAGYGPLIFDFIVKVADSNPYVPRESSGVFQLYIGCDTPGECGPPPEILFDELPDATILEGYFYEMAVAGGEGALTWELIEGELPDGIEFEDGNLVGAPHSGTEDEYPLTFQVCDECPIEIQCDTVEVTLVVLGEVPGCDSAPVVTTTSLPEATENEPYTKQLTNAGGHGNVTWEAVGGALPAGMTLTESGELRGTPPTGTGAPGGKIYNFTAQVCDSCPIETQCGTRDLVLTVIPAQAPCVPGPVITTESPIPAATVEVEYVFVFEASGGEGVLSWTLLSILPAGLLFNPDTGAITGTPEAGTAGDFEVEVEVADSCMTAPQTDSGIFDFSVQEPCGDPPDIIQNTIWPATEGIEFNFPFAADFGVEPLQWSQTEGEPFVNMGLTFEDTGWLHGTPSPGSAGVYPDIGIRVTDSCATGEQSDENLYTFTINGSGDCAPGPVIDSVTLPLGAPGVVYDATLEVSGGEGALTYELLLDGDALPTGLGFLDGTISGTPDSGTNGDYDLHFEVCDSCADPEPQCDDKILTLTIGDPCAPPPEITSLSPLPDALVDIPYEYQFTADNGEGTLAWLTLMGLPAGFNLGFSGLLTGTATVDQIGEYNFNINVNDECWLGGQNDNQPFILNVVPDGCMPPPVIDEIPNQFQPAGAAVFFQFNAQFGEGVLTWSLLDSTPALPGNVTLLPSGLLIGATDISDFGSYFIDVEVCDECDDPGPQCDTYLDFELELTQPVGCVDPPPSITDVTIPTPDGDGSPYSHTMTATDGEGSLIWLGVGFPETIMMDMDGNITGLVNPVDAGTYHVVVWVMDSCGDPQNDSIYVVWDIT